MFRKRQIIETMYIMMTVIVAGIIAACTPRSVREAQRVVAQADSLWAEGKMYGVDAGDSAQLAQTYKSLSSFNVPLLSTLNAQLSTSYAHACYHYGKLLCAKENPVEAMQAFISATHSRTRDYHILGRVYSNMGDICRIVDNHFLAYDMYQLSADYFLYDQDTLFYFYGLNNMAFELAKQRKEQEAQNLLRLIRTYPNTSLYIKSLETEALLYQSLKKYKSVIAIMNLLQSYGYKDVFGYTMKARAFSNVSQKDSALWYARKAVSLDPEGNTAIAAYYILSHDDNTLNSNSIRIITSARADVQKSWAYSQGKLSQAVQLLEQDLNREQDWRWLYASMGTLIIISIGIWMYVYKQHKKRELLSQKVEELKQSASAIQKKQDKLQTSYQTNHQRMEEDIMRQCLLLCENENLVKELAWSDFEAMTKVADKHFYKLISKLRNMQVLNETEIRLCLLVLLDMNRAEISDTLPYSLSGVGKLKDHTAKSLGTTGKNLRQFLINLAIEG